MAYLGYYAVIDISSIAFDNDFQIWLPLITTTGCQTAFMVCWVYFFRTKIGILLLMESYTFRNGLGIEYLDILQCFLNIFYMENYMCQCWKRNT